MECTSCGMHMVVKSEVMLASNPPIINRTWWCACGAMRQTSDRITHESLLDKWKRRNNVRDECNSLFEANRLLSKLSIVLADQCHEIERLRSLIKDMPEQ